ncbi:MAG TPA: hypothetical protein VKA07_12775 [Candidatus Sulfotelmatobacter sp.]|nr:hypothetical protein [Candidatus Sulfotelmatobacter sp.]
MMSWARYSKVKRTMRRTVAHFLLLFSTVAAAQMVQKSAPTDQDLTAEQKETVVKLANLKKNFGKKMNSPGVDLSLREIDRTPTTDRTLVRYELYAKGLPTDLTYTLFKVEITGKILKQLEGVTLDSNGKAISAGRKSTGGSALNSPIDLVFFGGKGEPIRLALTSNDDSHLRVSSR